MNTLMIVLGSASAGCFFGVLIASALRAAPMHSPHSERASIAL